MDFFVPYNYQVSSPWFVLKRKEVCQTDIPPINQVVSSRQESEKTERYNLCVFLPLINSAILE